MGFKGLSKALRANGPGDTTYVTIHESELDEPPKGLLDGIAGLAAVQPVRAANGKMSFISYWASEDDFTFSNPVLASRLSGAAAQVAGLAGQAITKPVSFFGRIKDKAVPILLTTVAVLGALDVLSNRYDNLIAAPQFLVRLKEQAYDLNEGEPLLAIFSVENALSVTPLSNIQVTPELTLTAVEVGAKPDIRLLDLQGTSLPATKAREMRLSIPPLPSGEHKLRVNVAAKAGYFREPSQLDASATVRVWPDAPEASIGLKQVKGNRADFSWTTRVGKADSSSVECGLILTGEKLSFPAGFWRPLNGESNATPLALENEPISKIQVSWPVVTSRTKYVAEFSLIGNEKTDWSKFEKLTPSCSLRRK